MMLEKAAIAEAQRHSCGLMTLYAREHTRAFYEKAGFRYIGRNCTTPSKGRAEPMQTAIRIVTHTPVWVFPLLAYLIWQGLRARRPRTQPIWRLLIVPLVFFLIGLSRLVTARGDGLEPLLAWLVAALLFAALAFSRGPKLLAVDRESGTVTRPGSTTPLVRNLTVFALQYVVTAATAMKLQPHAAVAIIGHAISGATAGYFSGFAAALLRRYRKSGTGENPN